MGVEKIGSEQEEPKRYWEPVDGFADVGYGGRKIKQWLNPKGEPATKDEMDTVIKNSWLGNQATDSFDYEILQYESFIPLYGDGPDTEKGSDKD